MDPDLENDPTYRAAIAYAERKTREAEEMGLSYHEPQARHALLSSDHRVTKAALKEAGVPESKEPEIQKLLDDVSKEMERSIAVRAKLNETKSDPARGIAVYEIPADRDRGDKILESLGQEFTRLTGPSSAKLLMSALRPTQQFGWYGKLDVEVKFQPQPDTIQADKLEAVFTCRDPETGTVILGGSSDMDHFRESFGDSFKTIR